MVETEANESSDISLNSADHNIKVTDAFSETRRWVWSLQEKRW